MAALWLDRLRRKVLALRHRNRLDRDLEEEVRFHLEMEADDLTRRLGLAPDEARRRARLAFGGVERYQEEHRDARGVRWLDELAQDLRYGLRSLARSPGFAVSSVLVLALAIGASTAVFSAVDAVLLDSGDDRVVAVFQQYPPTENSPTGRGSLSVVDFQAIEAQQRSFSAVGVLRWGQLGIEAEGNAERVGIAAATSGFFRALNIQPRWGRTIQSGDEPIGAPPVALVSYRFAHRRLGGAATAVGRTLIIDGTATTVVGVLSPGVTELAGIRGEVWPALHLPVPERRGPFGYFVIARLGEGVSIESAAGDLAGISRRIFPLWQSSYQDSLARLTPVPLREATVGDAGRMLGLLAAAVTLVLAIAVANVAGLMLVRASARRHEIGLRAVLGASRPRLIRLLLTESVLLAGAGTLAGLLFAVVGLELLSSVGPRIPRLHQAGLDGRAAGFAVAIALLAAIIMGVYPIALLFPRDSTPGLHQGDRTVGPARRTQGLRAGLVVVEFALALPLLAGAGLLLNSFLRLQEIGPGFDPSRVLAVRLSLPSARYPEDSNVAAFWQRALPLVREVPGVLAAGLGTATPPAANGATLNNFDLIDRPVPPGESQPLAPWPMVTADYFDALGVPLLDGRLFSPGDTAGAPPVVVVSRAWARRYFPHETAVGRRLISGGCTECPPTTVIGVVGDVRYEGLNGTDDAVYDPLTQGWSRDLSLFLRTTGSPGRIIEPVRAALRSVDAGVPLEDAAPMEDRLSASITQPRLWTELLAGFAGAAVGLAAIAIFGMLSYIVSARRREIGVRMALGAEPRSVIGMIVGQGMSYVLAGAGLGLLAALGVTRLLSGVLFEVSATDPPTFAAVTLLLLAVALIACWLPARRAAAIDPIEAIRLE